VNYAYRYFGLVFGRLTLRVSLDSAELADPADHAAVWVGCNADANRAWVQAGVLIERDVAGTPTEPSLYIEVGPPGPHYSMERWPWTFGQPVQVRLRRKGAG
jgi:hypothetical protein